GFVVLLTTIAEAYGELADERFALPLVGHAASPGVPQALTPVGVLVALVAFAAIRVRQSPVRAGRASRFDGSHRGQAWLILGMIALVVGTLLLDRGARGGGGSFPHGR